MKVKVTIPVTLSDSLPGEISFIADLKANILSTTDMKCEADLVISKWNIEILKED